MALHPPSKAAEFKPIEKTIPSRVAEACVEALRSSASMVAIPLIESRQNMLKASY